MSSVLIVSLKGLSILVLNHLKESFSLGLLAQARLFVLVQLPTEQMLALSELLAQNWFRNMSERYLITLNFINRTS